MNITARTKICMIIGDPVEHSLSPQMHNAGYKALRIDDRFVHLAARVNIEDIGKVVEAVRVLGIRGLTCTIPHKVTVLKYLDAIDAVAQKIGAANSIVNENGKVIGYNTDWIGVTHALEKVTDLKQKKAAIVGAGGAARAMVYALTQKSATVTIYNRSFEKAKALAAEFAIEAKSLEDLAEIKNADIILNATPIGIRPNSNETPLPKKYITSSHIVFDAIYNPYETRLLREAKEQGANVVHGSEMLLHEAFAKFKLYTGYDAPQEIMRKELMRHLL